MNFKHDLFLTLNSAKHCPCNLLCNSHSNQSTNVSISSITVGAAFTWTSPSIPKITADGSITLEEASYMTMIPSITIFIGAPIMAYLMDKIGRKPSLMVIFIPHFAAWVIIASTTSIYLFYLARFINGFGDAIFFTVLPNYMAEVSSPNVRGSWGNLPTIAIYFGQLLINIVGGYLSVSVTAGIFMIFPILFLITFFTLPESPYYLIMKERVDEARLSLMAFRRCENVEEELNKLINDVKRQTSETARWRDLYVNKTNRKALLAGMLIRGIQQFSGISAFSTYTVYIFNQAGLDMSSTVAAVIFCVLLVIMNSAASFTLDMLGRKLAMVISSGACSVVLLLQAIFFLLKDQTSVDTSSFSWFPLLGLALYVVFYSIGLGIVPTLIVGELFSASIKAKGVCGLSFAFAAYVLTTTKVFQFLSNGYGLYVPFLLYFVCTFLGTIASLYLVPETKGKTLEEIQQSMKK